MLHQHFSISIPKTSKKNQSRRQKQQPKKKASASLLQMVRSEIKRVSSQSTSPKIKAIAKLVANPCDGKIVPGIFGVDNGLVARFKRATTLNLAAGVNQGFVVWVPKFCGTTGAGNKANGYAFYSAGAAPVNTVASPFGLSTSEQVLRDPAYNFVSGGTCDTARTVAACLRFQVCNRVDTMSGQIVPIDNMPYSAIFRSDGTVASVDDIFSASPGASRMTDKTYEVRYKPLYSDENFVDEFDSPITTGTAASVASTFGGANPAMQQPTVIGFAWKNFDAATALSLFVEHFKVIEWNPESNSGMTVSAPTTSSVSIREQVVGYLDINYPGWTISDVLGGMARVGMAAYQASQRPPSRMFRQLEL